MKNFSLKSVLEVAIVSWDNNNDQTVNNPKIQAALLTEIKGGAKGKVKAALRYVVAYVSFFFIT